jgi:iron complex transport system ATP-binding protein
MICRLRSVSFRYMRRTRDAVAEVSLEADRGEHVAIVGPNGAGKSTVLRLLAGVIRPTAGTALLLDRPVGEWSRRELARRVAVVSQGGVADGPLTVREVVEMGRHPYVRAWAPLGPGDHKAVDEALADVDLSDLADRDVRDLSGGELQRVHLARAFAQQPLLLLLDEPTAHLDMGHEMRLLELVSQKTVNQSLTVISVTHHMNTASRFADRMLLMAGGRVVVSGKPRRVLQPTELERAFAWPVSVLHLEDYGPFVLPGKQREHPEGA